MFENLTNKFEEIFSSLKKAPSLNEAQVDEGLRGIRQALLEADVSLDVAKDFVDKVKPKALGQEIVRSTSPGQMVVKIVYDELVNLLGEKNSEVNLNAVPPVTVMMVGLQGSGKTTSTAKLASYLEKNKKKKVMMVSLDIYRPAAQEQLRFLGEQNNINTLPVIEGQLPTDICQRAINAAKLNGSDVILFDTAGRTQIDLQMMNEIKQIEGIINPTEIMLVADSLTGQVAANVAKEFKGTVNLTGIILTRSDGDGRGGAALSMKYVAEVPIKFLGVGEKVENLEVFHPDRIANRILGMGDIVSLVEKASEDIDQENIKKAEENLKKGQFTLEDYLSQLRQMKKMGGIEGVLSFLPGVSKMKSQMDQAGVDEKIISKMKNRTVFNYPYHIFSNQYSEISKNDVVKSRTPIHIKKTETVTFLTAPRTLIKLPPSMNPLIDYIYSEETNVLDFEKMLQLSDDRDQIKSTIEKLFTQGLLRIPN